AAVRLRPSRRCPGTRARTCHGLLETDSQVKRALITGASGTLGAAIAGELARAGLHVIVHGHSNVAQAQAIREQIQASGGSAEVAIFDVSSSEDCTRQMDLLLEAGPVQVLVHNAGITADAPMAAMS